MNYEEMTELQTVMEAIENSQFTELYGAIRRDVFMNLSNTEKGIRHKPGFDVVNELIASLEDCNSYNEVNKAIEDSIDTDAFIVEPFKDSEIWVFVAHDISISDKFDNRPSALTVMSHRIMENEESIEPAFVPCKFTATLIIGDLSDGITDDNYNNIIKHELVHIVLFYMKTIMGQDLLKLPEDSEVDVKLLEEFLCDFLPYHEIEYTDDDGEPISSLLKFEEDMVQLFKPEVRASYQSFMDEMEQFMILASEEDDEDEYDDEDE